MVLSVLNRGPLYGYRLQQAVKESSNGLVDLQAGTLYPLLHRLEAEKLIRCKWDDSTGRKRKWYELTAAGKKRLTAQAHEWNAFAECLRGMLATILETAPRPA